MRPQNTIRHCSLSFIICGSLAASAAGDGDLRPYEARVIVSGAAVHSGPGENFYATATLAQGETVEVYRELPNGWLGIRPPEGSFSWIVESDLELKDNELGEVNRDGAASRIGSDLGRERNAVQVKLKRREVVEVLGEDIVDGQTWYKIAPPAGEFRWMHASNIERMRLVDDDSEDQLIDASVVGASATSEESSTDEKTDAQQPEPKLSAKEAAESAPAGTWQAASSDNDRPQTLSAPPLAKGSELPSSGKPAAEKPPVVVQPPDARSAPAQEQPAVGPLPADTASQVAAIELRLSRMAAAPLSQWNTERLERDSEQLLATAQTPAERESVKALLAKIDRFNSLSKRHDQATGLGGMTDSTLAQPGAVAAQPAITPLAGVSPEEASKYDAVGVLRPVVSKRPGAPQFALVDERGQVVSFVTPTPDMNLQPYVGRPVGVVGNRGFIPEFQRAHVTAGRVQALVR